MPAAGLLCEDREGGTSPREAAATLAAAAAAAAAAAVDGETAEEEELEELEEDTPGNVILTLLPQ